MRQERPALKIARSLIATTIAACFSPLVFALPLAPTVVNGDASFVQSSNALTVTNSNGAIINWNSFSIGSNEAVRFIQTSSASSVLNRVLSSNPSLLLGTLQSNGRVFLINPAGILVGQGARIDVAGFVASTLNLSDSDFLANRWRFTETPGAGKVQNFGEISTPSGGTVYLIAPQVENHGIITAANGEVLLAAGQHVELIDTATPGVRVEIIGSKGDASNLGTIAAEAGRIGIAGVLVRNSGTLNASSVVSEGGRIFLKASTDTLVDGHSQISATGSKGGLIEVLGNRVSVTDNALIDASGQKGGGTVLLGGDYQGKNAAVQNAELTTFGKDALLKADATDTGDGGKVIVWANDSTSAYGKISARAGAHGGDGGFVEVSGKQHLVYRGITDTSAAFGKTGTLLLDPTSIGLIAGAGVDAGTTIYGDNITTNLGSSNVILQTSSGGTGDITFTAGNYDFSSATAANALTLLAFSDGSTSTGNISLPTGTLITMKAGAALNMVAGWDGVSVSAPAVVSGFGSISAVAGSAITAQVMKVTAGSNIVLDGANVVDSADLTTTSGAVSYHTVNPGTSHISANATGNIAIFGDVGSTSISLSELRTTGTSNITVNAQGQILEQNATGTGSDVGVADLVTGSGNITLTSLVGTPVAGTLAISADVETTGTVSTSVTGGPYGSIGIRDVGASAAGTVNISSSGASAEGSVEYYRYGNATIGSGTALTLNPRTGGTTTIAASGNLTFDGPTTVGSSTGFSQLSAGGDLTFLSGAVIITGNGSAKAANITLSGGDLTFQGSGSNTVNTSGSLNVAAGKAISATAGTLSVNAGSAVINGAVSGYLDTSMATTGTLSIGGSLLSSMGNLKFKSGGKMSNSGTLSAALGIEGEALAGLTMGAPASSTGIINASNGVAKFTIGGSGIEMYNGSYINSTDASQPAGGLIKLFFPGLAAGGSMIDGIATFDGAYKIGGTLTTLGPGLEVSYGILSNPVSDAIISAIDSSASSAGGTSAATGSLAIVSSSLNTGSTKLDPADTQTIGGGEGNFGGETSAGNGNDQDDKNAKRKPAQCRA